MTRLKRHRINVTQAYYASSTQSIKPPHIAPGRERRKVAVPAVLNLRIKARKGQEKKQLTAPALAQTLELAREYHCSKGARKYAILLE